MFKPSSNFLTNHSKEVLLLWILLLFVFRVCLSYLLVSSLQPCGHLLGLALVYVMFSCVFVTFPYGVLGNWLYQFLIFAFFLTLSSQNRNEK